MNCATCMNIMNLIGTEGKASRPNMLSQYIRQRRELFPFFYKLFWRGIFHPAAAAVTVIFEAGSGYPYLFFAKIKTGATS